MELEASSLLARCLRAGKCHTGFRGEKLINNLIKQWTCKQDVPTGYSSGMFVMGVTNCALIGFEVHSMGRNPDLELKTESNDCSWEGCRSRRERLLLFA